MMYPKNKPKRLKGSKLRELMESVVERDNWTCQNPNCNSGHPIDPPHHIKYRGQGGSDVEENLITLCTQCHYRIHHVGDLRITGDRKFIEGFIKSNK